MSRLLPPAVVLSSLLFAAEVRAQHCHPPERPDVTAVTATARFEAAHFDDGAATGTYEGFALALSYRRPRVRARVRLPVYRLLERSGATNGFGDLDAKLEVALYDDERTSFGAAASASFPTGDDEKRLGMGHLMAGPSVWVLRQSDVIFTGAELGFQRGWGGDSDDEEAPAPAAEHQHHQAAAAPSHARHPAIPSPMNRQELWLGATASYALVRELRLNGVGVFAVPVGEDGDERGTAGVGLEVPLGMLSTAFGFEMDLFGPVRRKVSFVSVSLSP